MTSALTNQQRVLAPAARRASAICPANDTSGATYLMTSHVSLALWTLSQKQKSLKGEESLPFGPTGAAKSL